MQRHNDRLVYEPETADPRRAAQLDQRAARVVAENIANGPAARAARVDLLHRANSWDTHGPLPEHLRAALSAADTLAASDGARTRRGTARRRRPDGHVAGGHLKPELAAPPPPVHPPRAHHT